MYVLKYACHTYTYVLMHVCMHACVCMLKVFMLNESLHLSMYKEDILGHVHACKNYRCMCLCIYLCMWAYTYYIYMHIHMSI